MKSSVFSFDCHVTKYPVTCEQLKAEVRGCRGGKGSVFSLERGALISSGL